MELGVPRVLAVFIVLCHNSYVELIQSLLNYQSSFLILLLQCGLFIYII